MSTTQFHLSDSVQRGIDRGIRVGMEAAMNIVIEEVVGKLSSEFEFDAQAAMDILGVVTMSKPKKPKAIQLPWCGEVIQDCCQALKVNKGLHSQCLNEKEDGGDFCKRCQTAANKNNGVPTYGTVEERVNNADYTDAKGKAPVNYGNYLKKEGITREAAEAEADKYGITIPEEQFNVVQPKKKGRKQKDTSSSDEDGATTSDTDSVSSEEAPKKKAAARKPKDFEGDTSDWREMSDEEQEQWKQQWKADKKAEKAAAKKAAKAAKAVEDENAELENAE